MECEFVQLGLGFGTFLNSTQKWLGSKGRVAVCVRDSTGPVVCEMRGLVEYARSAASLTAECTQRRSWSFVYGKSVNPPTHVTVTYNPASLIGPMTQVHVMIMYFHHPPESVLPGLVLRIAVVFGLSSHVQME